MPTPESEYFKANKPKVPPTFDGVDYDDNKALKAAQDAIIREQWVQSMMARLIREELGKCYHREGVNHLQNCQQLRGKQRNGAHGDTTASQRHAAHSTDPRLDRYMEQLKHAKVKGYLFQQQNYFENREG